MGDTIRLSWRHTAISTGLMQKVTADQYRTLLTDHIPYIMKTFFPLAVMLTTMTTPSSTWYE